MPCNDSVNESLPAGRVHKITQGNFQYVMTTTRFHELMSSRVAIHENDRNHENEEDNSDNYKQIECWISGNHGNHANDENHGNPRYKPQVPENNGFRNKNNGLEIPELRAPVREHGAFGPGRLFPKMFCVLGLKTAGVLRGNTTRNSERKMA